MDESTEINPSIFGPKKIKSSACGYKRGYLKLMRAKFETTRRITDNARNILDDAQSLRRSMRRVLDNARNIFDDAQSLRRCAEFQTMGAKF